MENSLRFCYIILMITKDVIDFALEEVENRNPDCFSKTRDIFSARLDSYISRSKNYLAAAVIGEIGNNSFDHNLATKMEFERGAYFNPDFLNKYVLLADYGRGILDSLKIVRNNLASDLDALKCAFTEMISGRAPEQRGNGLKFVLSTVKNQNWNLFYATGNAFLTVENGSEIFDHNGRIYQGCFAILELGEEK